ncbi:MAG: serine/threonine protein kinase [Holophagales bacterium]|nr:serine/threonine protein kinase [Holophagales bacterium]
MSERRPGLGETATWDADQGAGGGRDARPSGASAAPSLPPRFRPERLIGSGGQADVWLAHDLELNEPVAVKLFRAELDEVSRERLRREVRLGRTLSHERLVRMFELIEAGDRLAVAMEWVPGGSVAERLRAGPVSVEEAARIGRDTLEALAYLHAQGVIHRDVKPSNLLLDARGSVRLADFGLARPVGEAFDLTRTALSIGTPGYMSPEQIRGEPLGPATDLYGVGVTLFELLTGKQPFDGASAFEVARKHVSVAPPDPAALRRECPAWLSRFVLRLLEKSQGDRFPTAAVALEALSSRGSTASPRERRRRRRLLIGAAATFVGIALVWRPLSARLDPPSVVRTVVEVRRRSRRGAEGRAGLSGAFRGLPAVRPLGGSRRGPARRDGPHLGPEGGGRHGAAPFGPPDPRLPGPARGRRCARVGRRSVAVRGVGRGDAESEPPRLGRRRIPGGRRPGESSDLLPGGASRLLAAPRPLGDPPASLGLDRAGGRRRFRRGEPPPVPGYQQQVGDALRGGRARSPPAWWRGDVALHAGLHRPGPDAPARTPGRARPGAVRSGRGGPQRFRWRPHGDGRSGAALAERRGLEAGPLGESGRRAERGARPREGPGRFRLGPDGSRRRRKAEEPRGSGFAALGHRP